MGRTAWSECAVVLSIRLPLTFPYITPLARSLAPFHSLSLTRASERQAASSAYRHPANMPAARPQAKRGFGAEIFRGSDCGRGMENTHLYARARNHFGSVYIYRGYSVERCFARDFSSMDRSELQNIINQDSKTEFSRLMMNILFLSAVEV